MLTTVLYIHRHTCGFKDCSKHFAAVPAGEAGSGVFCGGGEGKLDTGFRTSCAPRGGEQDCLSGLTG